MEKKFLQNTKRVSAWLVFPSLSLGLILWPGHHQRLMADERVRTELTVSDRGHQDDGVENKAKETPPVEEREAEFSLSGQITAVSGNTFTVNGLVITIDPLKVDGFRQKGILTVGQTVKVKGEIKDGVRFAEDINVVGTGQGRFQLDINENPAGIGQTSPTVRVKAEGPLSSVATFLGQILAFLKGLIVKI